MMATVPHVTSGSGLGKFQADGFLLDRVYVYHWNFEDVSECRLEEYIKMDLRDIWGGYKLKSLAMVYITMKIRVQ